MDKIENIDTQTECLNRIEGYYKSMLRSWKKHGPNSPGVRTSLGFMASQIRRHRELGVEIDKEG